MSTVVDIIAAGFLPSALEAMDKSTMDATQTPYPAGIEAMLIVELDDNKQGIGADAQKVMEICQKNNAFNMAIAKNEEVRQALWQQRRRAASALAKIAPSLISLDSAVARSNLPQIITKIKEIFKKYALRGGIVFHAGDGNLHPNIAFDERNLFEVAQVKKAVKEIHLETIKLGGTLSGEHGIGVEKRAAMAQMFDNNTIALFKKIKKAVDPYNVANPDKVLPIASTNENKFAQNAPAYLAPIITQIKEAAVAQKPLIISGLKTKFKTKEKTLDLSSLNQILDIDKKNYTATVQAATPLRHLEKELAANNMYLPISGAKGTVGGVFAAKTFNNLADYITGLDFILADGAFISLGGKYIKNSAGYDLIRFLAGSQGGYAVITALTIRTFAKKQKPQKQNTFEFFKPNALEIKLKKVFDENNILNPFIFRGEND
jgi:FAD/FMN-containing dehydrogenase